MRREEVSVVFERLDGIDEPLGNFINLHAASYAAFRHAERISAETDNPHATGGSISILIDGAPLLSIKVTPGEPL